FLTLSTQAFASEQPQAGGLPLSPPSACQECWAHSPGPLGLWLRNQSRRSSIPRGSLTGTALLIAGLAPPVPDLRPGAPGRWPGPAQQAQPGGRDLLQALPKGEVVAQPSRLRGP